MPEDKKEPLPRGAACRIAIFNRPGGKVRKLGQKFPLWLQMRRNKFKP